MNLTELPRRVSWINRTVIGIVLATFFSDVSHEMATAVLPFYLLGVGFGAGALGLIEGTADFLVSISKLLGGYVGHHVQHKKPWAALGYLVTTVGTFGIGLVGSLGAVLTLRGAAWFGRGFRSPLRDYLLADAVEPSHYGRAYGLERAGDMLGAVTGPLLAALLLWVGWEFRSIILWTALPGLVAASLFFLLTRERSTAPTLPTPGGNSSLRSSLSRFPRIFWLFLIGVLIFGLGDFSRTFMILLAAEALGGTEAVASHNLSVAVLLYLVHNAVSAVSAYPTGWLGDRRRKMPILIGGYGLGVVTNLLLALHGRSLPVLVAAIVLSGIYIAIEETLEKAVAAELLPRELRSLGFGILACCNAVGDMASSFYVGFLFEAGYPGAAFGTAAACGGVGFVWMALLAWRTRPRLPLATPPRR